MTVHIISGVKMKSATLARETSNRKPRVLPRKTLTFRVFVPVQIGEAFMVTGDTLTWDGQTMGFDGKTFTDVRDGFSLALTEKKIGI